MTTTTLKPGDRAIVTRASAEGRTRWIGVIDRFDTDPAAEGFHLVGRVMGGHSAESFFAPTCQIEAHGWTQTIEPASEQDWGAAFAHPDTTTRSA